MWHVCEYLMGLILNTRWNTIPARRPANDIGQGHVAERKAVCNLDHAVRRRRRRRRRRRSRRRRRKRRRSRRRRRRRRGGRGGRTRETNQGERLDCRAGRCLVPDVTQLTMTQKSGPKP